MLAADALFNPELQTEHGRVAGLFVWEGFVTTLTDEAAASCGGWLRLAQMTAESARFISPAISARKPELQAEAVTNEQVFCGWCVDFGRELAQYVESNRSYPNLGWVAQHLHDTLNILLET